jgi:hypothetical protein
MVAKKKSRKKSKKITSLVEFRAWLEGVEEMQGDDWVPTEEQWTRIREKIDSIEITPAATTAIHNTTAYNPPPAPVYPPGPSAFDGRPAPPAINLNADAPIAAGQPRVKTPNIDTSMGDYKSAFE